MSFIRDSHKVLPGAPYATDGSIEMDIPELLQKGTPMTKISEKKRKQVVFRIDPDEGQILYKSRKGGLIPIESIKEFRSGPNTRYYRLRFGLPEELEKRWLTIVYILDGSYKTLHMIAESSEVFLLWETAIKKLHAIRQGLMSGLGNFAVRQAVWERQYWKGADEEGDQVLDFNDVERLCMRLNINISHEQLSKLFKDTDVEGKGHLDFPGFQRIVKVLKHRPDIDAIFHDLCSGANGSKSLDFESFRKFMRESQKSTLTDDQLKTVFSTHALTTPAEKGDSPPSVITCDGFYSLLMSSDNSPFSEKHKDIWQDMTRPLSEYYVSTSHNTYLVGHQLVGVSTVEGYIRALLHSCRSVELDIWDGAKEPTVYHGRTLTSKVPFRDVCQAISKYAFVTSPYPLLISAEVHCSVEQQDAMVEIMMEVFGDSLIQAPIDGSPKIEALPSPEELKHKFLIKAKNLYVVERLASLQAQKAADRAAAQKSTAVLEVDPQSDTSSSDTDLDIKEELKDLKVKWRKMRGKDTKPKIKMSARLAALIVYTVGVKCHGLSSDIEYAPEHIFSLSENAANKFVERSTSMADLIKHNQTHLVRIYPKGTRIGSTNFEPHRFWAAGAQLAAINWQTFDLGYVINQAMFQQNGRCGYVIKPDALRPNNRDLLKQRTRHFFDVKIISAQQLPRLRDSAGEEIIDKSIVDPFVEVTLHVPDWTHSPFFPNSATAAGAQYSPPTDANTTSATSARTVSLRTKIVRNNGFNPVWQEKLCLPFDCIGDMKDLIFVKFTVRQKGKDDEDDQPVGLYCSPLGSLEHGFRHLPLHDSQLSQYLFSTLFVQINIRDVAKDA